MTDPTKPEEPAIGSLAEEATKLFGTLTALAREHRAGSGIGSSDGSGNADALEGDDEATPAFGAGECTVCPWCRTVHALRAVSPEVREHLSAAASSLAQAASALLSTQPAGPVHRETPDRGDREPTDPGSEPDA